MILQPDKYLRIFYEGLGNIYYDLPAAAAPNVVDAANDGLSTDAATAKIAQLGQTVGRLGNPAVLLENREIPFDVFSLLLNNIGKAVGAHLKFKKDAAADANFDPFIEVLKSDGTALLKFRITDNHSLYINRLPSGASTGRNNLVMMEEAGGKLTTGRDNVLLGAGCGNGLTTQQGWVVIGEDNIDMFAGSNAGDFGICIGANNFNAGFITNIGNNFILLGSANNNSTGDSIGDFVIIIGGANMGLGGGMHDTIIIGNQATTGPTVTISNVVIIGTGGQNLLIGQSPVGAAFIDTGERVQIKGTVKSRNNSLGIRAGIAADTFTVNDNTLLMDSTAGNMTVSITPANLSSVGAGINANRTGIVGNVKKISADLNTITLNATSGLIYGLGAPAASLVFNTQGQSVAFQSDGTNIYIL
jgi:hypothetical protein